jgi:hypothetical protein
MNCNSIKVRAALSEHGSKTARVVCVSLGKMPIGSRSIDDVAYIELTPAMARAIARDLFEAGYDVERDNDLRRSTDQ